MGAILAKAIKPLPLSCVLHIIGFTIFAVFAGSYALPDETENDAIIEVEMTQEELKEVEEIQHIEPPPSILESAGAISAPVAQRAASGSQAALAAEEASTFGDGAVAAGHGNGEIAEAGSSFAAGQTGTGTGDVAGGDSNISTGNTQAVQSYEEPRESIGDIAARFAARVEANKKYPHAAVKLGQEGVVSVYATLSASGSLVDYGISSSSGYSSLDKAAINAVVASCPFTHGAGKSITFTVPVHFQLY